MPPDLKLIGGVAELGAEAGAVAELSPIEIMHRMSQQWRVGATAAERAETLRILLKQGGASKSLLRMLEGEMGEKVLSMSPNRIPKAILKAAGGSRKQAHFTNLLKSLRKIKPGGATPEEIKSAYRTTLRAAQSLPASMQDAMKRMGPEGLFKAGPTSVARVYDIATKESGARRLLRWATKGDPGLSKLLAGGPTQNLDKGVRAQIDELEGMARNKLSERMGDAKGVVGKGKAAALSVKESAVSATKGLTVAEEGTLGKLTKAGAKGLGRGAKLARGLGGLGVVAGGGLLAHEAYDALYGKSKKARAALEASRRGGTASVSHELMYDMLDRRADLKARRAALGSEPELMQQIIKALGGSPNKALTNSEAGFGMNVGQQGPSDEEMSEMLDRLLGQMRGT